MVQNDSKHTEASFLLIPTDSFALQVVQVPRIAQTGDFRADNSHTNRLLYPCCACARGNNVQLCL